MAVTTLPAGTSGTAVPNISPSGITLASGKILIGQASGSAAAKTPSGDVTIDVNGVMAIGASKVTEAMQVLADNTTNDVSITKHGYAPKAPNDATKYLDGTGAWTVPAGGGGAQYKLVTGATDTLDPDADTVIGVNRAGAVTITLPAASTAAAGKIFTVKDESGAAIGNAITLDLDGSDTMDGSATNPVINYNYGAIAFYSNGSNWLIV